MYRPVKLSGDSIAVPQLLFSKLGTAGGTSAKREALFQVALYLLFAGEGDAASIAAALRLGEEPVASALSYWEGAGLIEMAPVMETEPPPLKKRRRLTTSEVVKAGRADAMLGGLLDELQRLFGCVIGEGDINLFVTLYVCDGHSADLILLAASEAVANGAKKAAYVEKILATWRENGIIDCASADSYLKLQAQREQLVAEIAALMGVAPGMFTFAEKKKIIQWVEEYGYGSEMIEAARLAAGDKRNEVKYLGGILKKWSAKGFKTPREVQQADENYNIRVVRPEGGQGADILESAAYVPLNRRRQE